MGVISLTKKMQHHLTLLKVVGFSFLFLSCLVINFKNAISFSHHLSQTTIDHYHEDSKEQLIHYHEIKNHSHEKLLHQHYHNALDHTHDKSDLPKIYQLQPLIFPENWIDQYQLQNYPSPIFFIDHPPKKFL